MYKQQAKINKRLGGGVSAQTSAHITEMSSRQPQEKMGRVQTQENLTSGQAQRAGGRKGFCGTQTCGPSGQGLPRSRVKCVQRSKGIMLENLRN